MWLQSTVQQYDAEEEKDSDDQCKCGLAGLFFWHDIRFLKLIF